MRICQVLLFGIPILFGYRRRSRPGPGCQRSWPHGGVVPGPDVLSRPELAPEAVRHLNAKLTDGGWWKKSGSERAAAAKIGDPLAVTDDAARLIREKLYDHLETVGETGIRDLKQQYGALSSIEHSLRGQVNVVGRQAPLSLKELIGLTVAAATGPKGWAIAAIPYIDKFVNNPARMAARATRAAIGEEPILLKAGRAIASPVSTIVRTASPVVGALSGEAAEIKPAASQIDWAAEAAKYGGVVVPAQFDPNDPSKLFGGTVTEEPTGNVVSEEPASNPVVKGIAGAEGFNVPGSIPNRTHNPGDLSGDRGSGTVRSVGQGAADIAIFPTDAAGWVALNKDIKAKLSRDPEMNWFDLGAVYAPGAQSRQWAENAARSAGVNPNDRVADVYNRK
jgi:hypothetical protein